MPFEKKTGQQQPAVSNTGESFAAHESESGEAATSTPLVFRPGTSNENRHKLTPARIIALQRTVGNQAVQRIIARQSGQPPVSSTSPGQAIQRRLTSEATRAFTTATRQNPDYAQGRTDTNQHMSESTQKKVVDIRETFGKTGGAASDLKDFVRAYLLSQHAERLKDLEADTTKSASEKKKKKAFYLSKSLQTRDQFAALLKKGPAAPETQTFLSQEGFQGGVAVTPLEQQKSLAKGPRIDVRSTFIGGPVLGIMIRAHLFIVYTSSDGKQVYFRGGPDGPDKNEDGTPRIPLTETDMGEYTPGTPDWDPSAPSVTVLNGPAAANKLPDLIEATSVINAMQVPYVAKTNKLDGENCNATAWTILNRAGVPTKKPTGIHPGWGNQLGSVLKQGNAIGPKPDDLTATGVPRLIKGEKVQTYKDEFLMEKDREAAGGLPVTRLTKTDGISKIRFSDNKIAYVATKDMEKPRVVLPSGRPFQLKGLPNAIHVVHVGPKSEPYYPVSGEMLEVLDTAFTPGPAWDNKLVRIKYDEGNGSGEKAGYILGKELQAPRDNTAKAEGEGEQVVKEPPVVEVKNIRFLKMGDSPYASVLDEAKENPVRGYKPKKGDMIQVLEPDFTPGDEDWDARDVKIQYRVMSMDKIGYLQGADFDEG